MVEGLVLNMSKDYPQRMGSSIIDSGSECLGKTNLPPENHVWDFSAESFSCTKVIWSQVVEPHQENEVLTARTTLGARYYGYRYYSPDMGRWLNREPLGEAGALNIYSFVNNNSLRYIDLLGLLIKSPSPYGPAGGGGGGSPALGLGAGPIQAPPGYETRFFFPAVAPRTPLPRFRPQPVPGTRVPISRPHGTEGLPLPLLPNDPSASIPRRTPSGGQNPSGGPTEFVGPPHPDPRRDPGIPTEPPRPGEGCYLQQVIYRGGSQKSCFYKNNPGRTFQFQQWWCLNCPPIDLATCLVDPSGTPDDPAGAKNPCCPEDGPRR